MGVKVTNLDVVIANLNDLKNIGRKKFDKVADDVIDYMHTELEKDIALYDRHTLQVLAEMGHPYAKNNEKIPPHVKPFIHTQSGNLKQHIKNYKVISGQRAIMAVYVDEKEVPYIKWLVEGSSIMVPRPVFDFTWNRIKKVCIARVKAGISEAIGSKNQSIK